MRRFLLLPFLIFTYSAFSQSASKLLSRRIDSLLQQYAALDQFSGTVLVARKGEVILAKGYGLANREWKIPAKPGTRFRIASLTKQFTGMLIMQLKQANKLDLQASITKYLPWYPPEIGDRVTIHQLLTHTSGIPNFTNRSNFFSEVSHRDYSTRSFVEQFCRDSLEFEPGTRFNYSNSGYYILGAIIEAITHKTYGEVLKERILDVAGMSNTGIDDPREIIPDRAEGYELPYGKWENSRFINSSATIGAAGDMYSTAEDLHRWDRALYGDKLLSDENKRIYFTPYLNGYAYGLGVVKIVIGNEKDSATLMAHTGGINGFRTKILRIIETGEVIIALSNTSDDHSVVDISQITLNILLQLHRQSIPRPVPHIITETGKRIINGTAKEGIEFYKRNMGSSTFDFKDGEKRLNELGRYLSNMGRQKDGIAVLKFNTEQFPTSSYAFDSYADELEEDNQVADAIVNYRKAVSLDKANEHAGNALKRLESK